MNRSSTTARVVLSATAIASVCAAGACGSSNKTIKPPPPKVTSAQPDTSSASATPASPSSSASSSGAASSTAPSSAAPSSASASRAAPSNSTGPSSGIASHLVRKSDLNASAQVHVLTATELGQVADATKRAAGAIATANVTTDKPACTKVLKASGRGAPTLDPRQIAGVQVMEHGIQVTELLTPKADIAHGLSVTKQQRAVCNGATEKQSVSGKAVSTTLVFSDGPHAVVAQATSTIPGLGKRYSATSLGVVGDHGLNISFNSASPMSKQAIDSFLTLAATAAAR